MPPGDESTRTDGKLSFDRDDPNERLEYVGDLCNGLPWGNGSMTWTYGASYQGEWIAGDRHGSGRYTLPAAEILESELATEAEFLLSAPGLNQDHPGADDDLEFDDDDSRLIKYHTRLFVLKTDGNTTGEGEH